MDHPPVSADTQARPATPPDGEVDGDKSGPCPLEVITTELLRISYAGDDYTWAVHDRLYPQLRELIRDTLDQLRDELRELDPRLTLTSIND
jgi:hypothetical protein